MDDDDALNLFPEEVWEIILNNLENSTDFWNVFRAFPQLDSSSILQKKKPLWLFGLIVPILIPWERTKSTTTKMLLNCRQTCKHWSTAVDTFLENQPQLRAYNHQHQSSEQFPWDPKAWIGDTDVDRYWRGIKESSHIGGVKVRCEGWHYRDPISVLKFFQAMDQHSSKRNPFLSRSLSVCGSPDPSWTREMRKKFWSDMISLHKKIGKHVWCYQLQFCDLFQFNSQLLVRCIGKLKNLKSLHIHGMNKYIGSEEKRRIFLEKLENGWPAFPNLETIKIVGDLRLGHLNLFLMQRFKSQIRRLELGFNLWRLEFSQLFPNLTELKLLNIVAEPVDIKNVILSLEAPQLAKLQLQFHLGLGEPQFWMEDDVFVWLKRFPLLRCFMIGEGWRVVRIKERGTLLPEADSVKSLQFLSFRPSFGMSFNFLQCLPSLQHLNLFVPLEPVVIDHSTNPKVRIWEEIQTGKLYNSNIWELLPKLRTLNLLVEEREIVGRIRASYEFHREHYEQTKREATLASTSDFNFYRLRQDIFEYTGICRGLADDNMPFHGDDDAPNHFGFEDSDSDDWDW